MVHFILILLMASTYMNSSLAGERLQNDCVREIYLAFNWINLGKVEVDGKMVEVNLSEDAYEVIRAIYRRNVRFNQLELSNRQTLKIQRLLDSPSSFLSINDESPQLINGKTYRNLIEDFLDEISDIEIGCYDELTDLIYYLDVDGDSLFEIPPKPKKNNHQLGVSKAAKYLVGINGSKSSKGSIWDGLSILDSDRNSLVEVNLLLRQSDQESFIADSNEL